MSIAPDRTLRPTRPLMGGITRFFRRFADARRHEALFALSDAQLAARGLSRDGLVKSYIGGLGHR